MGPIMGSFALPYRTESVNIVFHGNSLVYGQSGATVPTGAMPYQVQRLPPINNRVSCINMGANGQNWSGMLTAGTGASVDALFDVTKKNILVAWEGFNAIANQGKTPAAAYADAQAYTAQRLAAKPWMIVHMTCIPGRITGWSDATAISKNADLIAYNNLLKSGWRSIGAKALSDLTQAGGPFVAPPDYTTASFSAITVGGQSVWSPGEPGQWVHLSDAGYGAVAQMLADTLRRVPAR